MLRWLSGAFPSVSRLIALQGKSEYGCPGVGLFFFISRSCGGRPDLQEEDVLPDREKCFNLSPRDLGPSPLNAGQVWHLDLCVTLGV